MAPQDVATFQLEHVQDMCAIASVLRNPAEADATNYTVSVDGSNVQYTNASFISTDGLRHSALVYESSCATHNISISASNICGQSTGAEIRIVLNVTLFDSASNIEGKFHVFSIKAM